MRGLDTPRPQEDQAHHGEVGVTLRTHRALEAYAYEATPFLGEAKSLAGECPEVVNPGEGTVDRGMVVDRPGGTGVRLGASFLGAASQRMAAVSEGILGEASCYRDSLIKTFSSVVRDTTLTQGACAASQGREVAPGNLGVDHLA